LFYFPLRPSSLVPTLTQAFLSLAISLSGSPLRFQPSLRVSSPIPVLTQAVLSLSNPPLGNPLPFQSLPEAVLSLSGPRSPLSSPLPSQARHTQPPQYFLLIFPSFNTTPSCVAGPGVSPCLRSLTSASLGDLSCASLAFPCACAPRSSLTPPLGVGARPEAVPEEGDGRQQQRQRSGSPSG
jgi:hypothetical protein